MMLPINADKLPYRLQVAERIDAVIVNVNVLIAKAFGNEFGCKSVFGRDKQHLEA